MIDMWQKRTILLTKLTQPVWVREKKQTVDRREKKSGILEREALPSLYNSWRSDCRFPARQEAKLLPTARATRGYRFWGSFNKLRKVGVFSYLYYSLAEGHFNGLRFVKTWMAVFSAPKDLD